jgi:aspartyl-tRNA(Asn)/glutamyl-tRNA(Gln) amidotransferase subunit C
MSMSKLVKKQVLHVAKLANLTLTPSEVNKYLKQLSEVLDHVSQLNEVNTEGVEPTHQTTGLEDVYRIDEVVGKDVLSTDAVLSGSEKTYNVLFKVDAVLGEREEK